MFGAEELMTGRFSPAVCYGRIEAGSRMILPRVNRIIVDGFFSGSFLSGVSWRYLFEQNLLRGVSWRNLFEQNLFEGSILEGILMEKQDNHKRDNHKRDNYEKR